MVILTVRPKSHWEKVQNRRARVIGFEDRIRV